MSKLLRQLVNLDLVLAGVCMVLLLCATMYGVLMRYVLSSPITWLEEVQMLLIVWLVFFGGSGAFRLRAHMAIEIVVDMLPAMLQKFVKVIVFLIVSAVLIFIAMRGYDYIARLASGNRVSNILRIPYALTYAAVPVGAALMLLNYWAATLVPLFRGSRLPAAEKEGGE